MIHVIDTHALTRYIEDHRRLGPAGRAIFSDPGSVLVVPTIVLAEARFMIFKNKANIVWHDITRLMADDGRFVPVALTLEITGSHTRQLGDARWHHRRNSNDVARSLGRRRTSYHSRQGYPRLRPRRNRLVVP